MQEQETNVKKTSKLRRLLKISGIGALALVLLCALLYFSSPLLVKHIGLPIVNSKTGLSIRAEEVGFAPLSKLRLESVRVAYEDVAEIEEIEIEKMLCLYNVLPMLFSGKLEVERFVIKNLAAKGKFNSGDVGEDTESDGGGNWRLKKFDVEASDLMSEEEGNVACSGVATVQKPDEQVHISQAPLEGEMQIQFGEGFLPENVALQSNVGDLKGTVRNTSISPLALRTSLQAVIEKGGAWQLEECLTKLLHNAEQGGAVKVNGDGKLRPDLNADLDIELALYKRELLNLFTEIGSDMEGNWREEAHMQYNGNVAYQQGKNLTSEGDFVLQEADSPVRTVDLSEFAPFDVRMEHKVAWKPAAKTLRIKKFMADASHQKQKLLSAHLEGGAEIDYTAKRLRRVGDEFPRFKFALKPFALRSVNGVFEESDAVQFERGTVSADMTAKPKDAQGEEVVIKGEMGLDNVDLTADEYRVRDLNTSHSFHAVMRELSVVDLKKCTSKIFCGERLAAEIRQKGQIKIEPLSGEISARIETLNEHSLALSPDFEEARFVEKCRVEGDVETRFDGLEDVRKSGELVLKNLTLRNEARTARMQVSGKMDFQTAYRGDNMRLKASTIEMFQNSERVLHAALSGKIILPMGRQTSNIKIASEGVDGKAIKLLAGTVNELVAEAKAEKTAAGQQEEAEVSKTAGAGVSRQAGSVEKAKEKGQKKETASAKEKEQREKKTAKPGAKEEEEKVKEAASETEKMTVEKKAFPPLDLKVKLDLNDIRYEKIQVTTFSGNIHVKDGSIHYRPVKLAVNGGKINADGKVVLDQEPLGYETDCKIESLPVEPFLHTFVKSRWAKRISGDISMPSCVVSGVGTEVPALYEKLDAEMKLDMDNFRFRRIPWLQKYARKYELASLSELFFKTGKCRLKVQDRLANLDVFEIEGPELLLNLSGDVKLRGELPADFTLNTFAFGGKLLKQMKAQDMADGLKPVREDEYRAIPAKLPVRGKLARPESFEGPFLRALVKNYSGGIVRKELKGEIREELEDEDASTAEKAGLMFLEKLMDGQGNKKTSGKDAKTDEKEDDVPEGGIQMEENGDDSKSTGEKLFDTINKFRND